MEPYPFRQGNLSAATRPRAKRQCFNGALPIQAGKPCEHHDIALVRVGFNGALPIQAGKLQIVPNPQRVAPCFNGALPIQAGKPSERQVSKIARELLQWSPTHSGRETYEHNGVKVGYKWLQWSPTHSGRETAQPHPSLLSAYIASMEPYPFRQGNHAVYVRQPRGVHASMEPYPFRQGNQRNYVLRNTNMNASMEPYPFRQGNL